MTRSMLDLERLMVAEHPADYGSTTAVAKAVAEQLRIGKETVRRWVAQTDIDAAVARRRATCARATPP